MYEIPLRLPELLRSACSDGPDRSSVNELVLLACRLARAYLRARRFATDGSGGLQSLDDLALDLVADLFSRDARGHFTELRAAFADVPDDPDLAFARFRRVVFGRITEGVFDHHRANDPEFARIVRNLKAAAQRSGIGIEARYGTRWLVFEGDRHGLPTIAPEILESMLTGRVREGMSVDDVLTVMADVLVAQAEYRRALPVVMAARVVRSTWNRLQRRALLDSVTIPPDAGSEDGFDPLRVLAMARVRAELGASYVDSGKLDPALFETYLAVVERHLAEELRDPGCEASLFEQFRELVPGLDRREYNARHRARLEYVWRRAREAMARNVRIELGISANPSDCKE